MKRIPYTRAYIEARADLHGEARRRRLRTRRASIAHADQQSCSHAATRTPIDTRPHGIGDYLSTSSTNASELLRVAPAALAFAAAGAVERANDGADAASLLGSAAAAAC